MEKIASEYGFRRVVRKLRLNEKAKQCDPSDYDHVLQGIIHRWGIEAESSELQIAREAYELVLRAGRQG